MKFYAIAYQYEEDVFYDFENGQDTLDAPCEPKMLLPTKEMAEQFIEDELSDSYVPVEIEIESYRNGITSYSRSRIEQWDSQYDEEDEE